jgi:hypothetical protein
LRKSELVVTMAAWLFAHAVAAVDCHWAIQNRGTADYWEVNPLARALIVNLGVWAGCALRLSTLAFGAAVASIGTSRGRRALTLVVLVAHLYLAAVYGVIFWRSN